MKEIFQEAHFPSTGAIQGRTFLGSNKSQQVGGVKQRADTVHRAVLKVIQSQRGRVRRLARTQSPSDNNCETVRCVLHPDAHSTGNTVTNTNVNKSKSPPFQRLASSWEMAPAWSQDVGGVSNTRSGGRSELASMAGGNSLHHEYDDHDVEADEIQLCHLVSHESEATGQE